MVVGSAHNPNTQEMKTQRISGAIQETNFDHQMEGHESICKVESSNERP